MTNLSALAATLHAIQAAYKKLEKGKLSKEEIETLLENSREIYDRAVILRYKAFEEKVFGISEINVEVTPEKIEEEPIMMREDDLVLETIVDEEEEIAEEIDTPFDFSLFDDSAEEVKNEELVDEAIEHISVTKTSSDNLGLHEEKVIMEQVTITPTSSENQRFITKFSKTDPNNASQIQMSKLDSLVGCFGLNERLQYINELFDGSSEAFADSIKEINNVSSIDEALIKVSSCANQYNWDLDSETVEEFVIKIKRRHG